jgi:hypothetical protein
MNTLTGTLHSKTSVHIYAAQAPQRGVFPSLPSFETYVTQTPAQCKIETPTYSKPSQSFSFLPSNTDPIVIYF